MASVYARQLHRVLRNWDQVEREAVHPCALVPVPQVLAGLLRGATMTAPLDRERLVAWLEVRRLYDHASADAMRAIREAIERGDFDAAPSVPCEALVQQIIDGIWDDLDHRCDFDLNGMAEDVQLEMRDA